MKKGNKWLCFVLLALNLLSIQCYAKTIYYVKSGANGDGRSWQNASGSIQDMINKASPGDDVWIAGGTYRPSKEYEWDIAKYLSFKLKSGVSLYGGFVGSESRLSDRKKTDRDNNGIVESWEFEHVTTLSGDCDNLKDKWIQDDRNHLLEVEGFEDNSDYVLRYMGDDFGNKNNTETFNIYISGITISGGRIGLTTDKKYLHGDILIDNCEFCYNKSGVYYWSSSGKYSIIMKNSNVHHNKEYGLVGVDFIENTRIHFNGNAKEYVGGLVGGVAVNCEIYDNNSSVVSNQATFHNCRIYNNIAGGMSGDAYDCIIYGNRSSKNGGGVTGGTLYNCIIRDNYTTQSGGGTCGATSINCLIYNNEALLDGGGTCGTDIKCSIFNNKAGGRGGGGASNCYSCVIYNNSASEYGGVYSSEIYNCTLMNNKSLLGNENSARAINSIIVGTLEGYASGCALTDNYLSGEGNFLTSLKELKLVKPTTFIGTTTDKSKFQELYDANFEIQLGSSAIDMGIIHFGETDIPIEDRNGFPRPMGESIDVGAHEYTVLKPLPYTNNFDEKSLTMLPFGIWRIQKPVGKKDYYLCFSGRNNYFYSQPVTTPLFEKVISSHINLSFDFSAKYKTDDGQEKMFVVLAYPDTNKQDTIAIFRNTELQIEKKFSKEISTWVNNKVFRVLFIAEGSNGVNIVYSGISNLKITKLDSSVEITAKNVVYSYNGKPHYISYTIDDDRVDKSKVKVIYKKDGAIVANPIDAGVYSATIFIEDNEYVGMKEVTLTIEKANQQIIWEQQIKKLSAKETVLLKATATSGLDVLFESKDTDLLKVEKRGTEWWAIANTIVGYVDIRAYQEGNSNYNGANSLIKAIEIISSDATANEQIDNTCQIEIYPSRFSDYIQVSNLCPEDLLYLFSSSGKICRTLNASAEIETMDVSSVGSGIYYLCVMRNGVRLVTKTVIKN